MILTYREYSPKQALELLIEKIRKLDPSLADIVQAAIDTGKDIPEETDSFSRKKKRTYRKRVPFSHEEALKVAIDVLQAYFVEQPLFVNVASATFAQAAVGVPNNRLLPGPPDSKEREPVSLERKGEDKKIEIELQTETQIAKSGEETLNLKCVPEQQIEEQRQNIRKLRDLTYSGRES